MFNLPKLSDERATVVIEEINAGSALHLRFAALLITSAMIACFGLSANSTAVIIGAMLVSPLMTPIFGVALSMLQGNASLLGRSLATEAAGVALAIVASWALGLFSLQFAAFEATPEMLMRTQPTLLDLLVAVFAGFAGAYALLDARISPALPGVAIATAIVPPLSTCGLCLSLGQWPAAFGAFLLFLANFVSILIVALLTFAIGGLAKPADIKSWRAFVRRFGLPVVTFVFLFVVLTNSLMRIADERFVDTTLRDTLTAEFSTDNAVDLEEYHHNIGIDRIEILATVRAPRVVRSSRVDSIQQSLAEAIGRPVDLVVRTMLAKDVAATGTYLQVRKPDLNGSFLATRSTDFDVNGMLAEQVIRQHFEGEPGFELTNVEFGLSQLSDGIVLAYVNSLRRLSRSEIAEAERVLREALNDPKLSLYMRVDAAPLQSPDQLVRVEWTNWRNATASEIERIPEWERYLRETIAQELPVIPLQIHLNFEEEQLGVLVEVVGPQTIAPVDTQRLEEKLAEGLPKPCRLHLWYRSDYVVNARGYTTFEQLSDSNLDERRESLRATFESRGTAVMVPDKAVAGP